MSEHPQKSGWNVPLFCACAEHHLGLDTQGPCWHFDAGDTEEMHTLIALFSLLALVSTMPLAFESCLIPGDTCKLILKCEHERRACVCLYASQSVKVSIFFLSVIKCENVRMIRKLSIVFNCKFFLEQAAQESLNKFPL